MGFEDVSLIAQQESWRKEIYRPMSYIHKWWARRLGSIFRGLIVYDQIGESFAMDDYYNPPQMEDKVIFDPFMGSGTTVFEACKLGAKAIGCDINPIASNLVCTILQKYSIKQVEEAFKEIEYRCADKIMSYYKTSSGEDVMYYLWVSTIECECCSSTIALHKNYIFAKNAYASVKPSARVICPICGTIFACHYKDNIVCCPNCKREFDPQAGTVDKTNTYTCPICGKRERVIDYIRRSKKRLKQNMFCKIVIHNSQKEYMPIDEFDRLLYIKATEDVKKHASEIPDVDILDGINTRQIINYGYSKWRDMFNDRQLLSIALLANAIQHLSDSCLKNLFLILLSGTLEFNNMFCSYKGEGTGAVRPLFYNHILKPELSPLEANLWGTNASSGAFSSFFHNRLMRALQYKANPFEVYLSDKTSGKYYLERLDNTGRDKARFFNDCCAKSTFKELAVNAPVIYCQDSSVLNIPDKTVDLVLTDPPFFDNVNYSELADFFFAWQSKWGIGFAAHDSSTTRQSSEVQDSKANTFGEKLCAVFLNCNRILKDDGRLIFTYHHSRKDGWLPVYHAITQAGFQIEETMLVKAEMAVSVAIMSAKEPINYDLVFICKKYVDSTPAVEYSESMLEQIKVHIKKFTDAGLKLSTGDKMMLIYGKVLELMSKKQNRLVSMEAMDKYVAELRNGLCV